MAGLAFNEWRWRRASLIGRIDLYLQTQSLGFVFLEDHDVLSTLLILGPELHLSSGVCLNDKFLAVALQRTDMVFSARHSWVQILSS